MSQNSKWAAHQTLTALKSEEKFNKAVAEFVKAESSNSPATQVEEVPVTIVPEVEEVATETISEVPEAEQEVEEAPVELKPITKKSKNA